MRCNQVSIQIERFGDYVPKSYPSDVQKIDVYVDDAKSIYAALSKAYALAINELAQYETIGCRANVYTNEFSRADYRKMRGVIPEEKIDYETDINLEYTDTNVELCKDRMWVYENSDKILGILKNCDDPDQIAVKLKEEFGLDDYQIRKLSQMRFDMLTKAEYENAKLKLERQQLDLDYNEASKYYSRIRKKEINQEISKLEAYFVMAANYEDMVSIMLHHESSEDAQSVIAEKYGLEVWQAAAFKYYSLNDFSKEEQLKKKEKLDRLRENLKYYE